ncbi:MAG: nucleotide exchange factor GrpE [Candidatus Thermofonsia Clade 1 bacterium]|uniref:Protein GrpE n=1 Tax=Candidatus Thermofonsia Clade 1 bacterium TaxID=2364210 RepID=A0A2M8PZ39_9CHLR|nr:MAG: nucleotide exchange factor GrpE [Candidatus Thermofonsia Clade 1 bacterium]PJF42804.1 MAG: nucleotide exchange factor GrpE [Candidatus Thermofonsia Clade 1 bacterium]
MARSPDCAPARHSSMERSPSMSEATDQNAAQTQPAAEAQAPAESAEALQAQLEEALRKADEYLSGWKRALAEFDNYRKRAEREREEISQNATVETLRRLLPVIDDFERALGAMSAEQAEDEVLKGFVLIHRKLLSLLESANLMQIDPTGQPFDPTRHEAIGQEPSDQVASGHVCAVLQKGYVYGDRVIRPALVRVAE